MAAVSLSEAKARLEDRQIEKRHAALELEAASYQYTGFNAEQLAIIKLYSEDPYAEWVHPGLIDLSRRPKKQRPVPPENAEEYIFEYGANFENLEDPRIPKNQRHLIYIKLLIGSLPTLLESEIFEAFEDKYSYTPSCFWDYADFQEGWKNGSIPKLGG